MYFSKVASAFHLLWCVLFIVGAWYLVSMVSRAHKEDAFRRHARARVKLHRRHTLWKNEQLQRVDATLSRIQALVDSDEPASVLELGDIYRKGDYPAFAPDLDMALALYHVGSTHPATAGLARLKYLEARHDTLSENDVAGAALPRSYGLTKVQKSQNPPSIVVPPPVLPQVEVLSDAQNVHDHSLTRHVKKALAEAPTGRDSFENVTRFILEDSDATPEEKADAYAVLESLGTQHHSTLGVSERESLDRMWTVIENLPTHKAEAKELLVRQLASGVEHGDIVCSTGKITRIAGALDGLPDREPVTKPMWALREELGTLAARVRDDEKDAPEFRRLAMELYVRNLGMSESLIDEMVSEFSSGF